MIWYDDEYDVGWGTVWRGLSVPSWHGCPLLAGKEKPLWPKLYKLYKLFKLVCICFLLLFFSIFSSIYWRPRWRWRLEWKMLLYVAQLIRLPPTALMIGPLDGNLWVGQGRLSPSPLVLFGNIQTQQCHHLWTRSSPPFSTLRAGEARRGPPRGTIRAFGRIWRWWPGGRWEAGQQDPLSQCTLAS